MAQPTKKNDESAKKQVTRAHIIQSAMAGAYILLIFWAMNTFHSELAVASLGASTFIAFSLPNAQFSKPRFLIGGYCVGVLSGLVCCGLSMILKGFFLFPSYILGCALAVFISMILMTTLHFEHPPAAALAVAVTIDRSPIVIGFAGLGCILALCLLKGLMKKYLRNLY